MCKRNNVFVLLLPCIAYRKALVSFETTSNRLQGSLSDACRSLSQPLPTTTRLGPQTAMARPTQAQRGQSSHQQARDQLFTSKSSDHPHWWEGQLLVQVHFTSTDGYPAVSPHIQGANRGLYDRA